MSPRSNPPGEAQRLAALRSYAVLDTAPEPVFDDLVALAARLADAPVAFISLVDRNRIWFKARLGLETPELARDGAVCAHALLTPDLPLVVRELDKEPRLAGARWPDGMVAYAGVPLVNPEGHALGMLCVMDRRPRDWTEAEVSDLGRLGRQVVMTLEWRRARLRAETLAHTDVATGLPNRRALLETTGRALARAKRDGLPVTLLCCRLLVAGGVSERLLDAAAGALLQCIRAEDMPARIGPEAFAALLVGGDGAEGAVVGERLGRALAACIEADGATGRATIAAICFLETPQEETEALGMTEALLAEAEAMGTPLLCREHVAED